MKEEFKFMGIDAGNSACKYAYYSGGAIRYGLVPNITGPAIHLDFPPAGRDEDILSVQVLSADEDDHRRPMFIGELARQQLQECAEQDRNRNKVDSDGINLILPAVLGLRCSAEQSSNEQIILGVGATLQDYGEQAPKLQKKLTRKHEIKFFYGSNAGLIMRPVINRTYTYAQAAAGLLGQLRTDEGRLRRTDWADAVVLALDFGHGQINIAVMDRLQFIKQACFSMDYGFFRVASQVQQFLNGKPHYVTATIPQLQEVVEKGYYTKNNNKIDIKPVIDKACSQLMDMVFNEVTSRISKVLLDKVNVIEVMGGGGKIMAPYVGSKFEVRPEVAENSLYSNARGLLLVAKEKWEHENVFR